MSKDLHPSILQFFEERMRSHSNVTSFEDVSTDEFFLYRVHRKRPRDVVLIWLSDAYRFTDMDYYNRPQELGVGDFALIARPEAAGGLADEIIEEARIGVGKVGELMGALTRPQIWKYRAPSWEEQKRRRELWKDRR